MKADMTINTSDEAALEADVGRAREYASASRAENTKRAYRSDWADFNAWCNDRGLVALPASPVVVGTYLAARAETLSVSTLRRRLISIAVAHRTAGHDSPTDQEPVPAVIAGIARTKGVRVEGKTPVLLDDLRRMLAILEPGRRGIRDRALLLLGFATGSRRAELVALDVEDITMSTPGLTVFIRRSKTDQLGEGRKIGVPFGRSEETCPVLALAAWLEAAGLTTGPIFRAVDRAGRVGPKPLSAQMVRLVVLRTAKAAGIDPKNLGAHSLRSGLVTSAVIGGASELAIMRQTGHASVAMVRRYTRDADLFRGNVVHILGL